jgi:hypothetical protein
VLASSGSATVIKLAQFEFAGLPVTTFDGWATGTEVNGLTVDGILFNYLVDGVPTNGQLTIYGSDNFSTNHVLPPFITSPSFSGSSHPGTLLLTLPTFADALGYGFVEQPITLSDATTITLFNGNTSVGSLVYSSFYDAGFPGGFAGIGSTVPFNRVALDFSTEATVFGVDNIVYQTPGAIPEPGTLLLVASGIGGLLAGRRLFRTF